MIIAVAIFITSCVGPFTMEDNGSTVNLPIDDVFEIDLETSGSNGYVWKLMNYDTTVVKQVGEPVFESKDGSVGSSGIKTYKFKTLADGKADLLIVYSRRWEEHKQPAKMFKMKIVVGTMGRILEE